MQDVPNAMCDPTRRTTLAPLGVGAEARVCKVMVAREESRSRMSWHMKVLREAGLVLGGRNAQRMRDPDLAPDPALVIDAALAAQHSPEPEVT